MLNKIDLNKTLDKKVYKKEMKAMEKRLAVLQEQIKAWEIPVVIAFEGWSASGKGTLISRLLYPLDPRNFNVYTMAKVSEEAYLRPVLWSYWTKTPLKGRITIFDKSWQRAILPAEKGKWHMGEKAEQGFFYDANAFEKQLSDDGTLLIKLFLHISKEEQEARFTALEQNPATKWRIDASDWRQNREYAQNLKLYEHMIKETNTSESKWHIIESNDYRYAVAKIYKLIISRLEEAIALKKDAQNKKENAAIIQPVNTSVLKGVDLSKAISDKDYRKRLDELQEKIAEQGFQLYTKRQSVVIVYEGWDAAGKGGNIKRVTEELDPRGYEVVPIAAPTKEELNHHYLWRFWNKMPKDGHIAIFDRSWYGRVMVERVEGFSAPEVWQRAYKEINDMELHMTNHGAIIFKFWLHIDKDEQLRRFTARQEDPLKQHKITDEDWRNREKWDQYEIAIDEMLFRTNTSHAPWVIVESNHKKYARIKTLEYITNELEKRLK